MSTVLTETQVRGLLRLRSIDAEFAQAMVEGCAINSEARGSSVGATDHPVQFAQYTKNVIALDRFEGCRSVSMI